MFCVLKRRIVFFHLPSIHIIASVLYSPGRQLVLTAVDLSSMKHYSYLMLKISSISTSIKISKIRAIQ